jgi:hypothetical protein
MQTKSSKATAEEVRSQRDELLAAAKTLVASLKWEEGRSGTTYSGYEQAKAAIARAEGVR